MTETRFKISTQEPHDKQIAFIKSPAKRKVIVAGRRGGKTTGVAILAADMFMAGRHILEAAPTQDQTERFWEVVKQYFEEPITAGFIYKNETKRVLELPNGGRLRTKTAWDADTLRGDYADLLILDEFADMDFTAWDEVGAPMLLDNDGDAIFIGTPKRRNHFFRMYQTAIGDDTKRWDAWHFTSFDNPHLSREALAEITRDMTQAAYQQEIMAQFLEGEGAVFRNIDACMGAPLDVDPKDHAGHTILAGVDWAKSADYTAVSIGCRECQLEIARDRYNQVDYEFQTKRLQQICEKYNVKRFMVEMNSMGVPNFESLQRKGLPVIGFYTTATSKPPLVENLALALERAEWQFQDDPVWTGELEAYEMKMNPITNRTTYSAPDGMHDDTVMARALMLRAADSGLWYI